MTEPRRVVLLDLDGTLTESGPGIIKCVIKAFEAVDVPVPNDEALQRFIGPAIIDSMKLNGIPPQKLDEAVRVYRHFYGDANVFNDPNEPGRKVPGPSCQLDVRRHSRTAAQNARDGLLSRGMHGKARVSGHSDLRAFPSDRSCRRHLRGKQRQFAHHQGSGDHLCARQNRCGQERRRQSAHGGRSLDRCGRAPSSMGSTAWGCGWGYAEPNELREHGAYRVVPFVSELADAVNDYFTERQ